MGDLLPVIVAVIAGSGAAFVTGWLARPKTKADAQAVAATASVGLSADAREWAVLWMGKAQEAEDRAAKAERRCDAIEAHLDAVTAALVSHIRRLEAQIGDLGGEDLPPFPDLPMMHTPDA